MALEDIISSPHRPDLEVIRGVVSTGAQTANPPNYPFPYCGVKLQGSPNETLGLRYQESYYPIAGDVVEVVWFGGDGYVLGALSTVVSPKVFTYRANAQVISPSAWNGIAFDTPVVNPCNMDRSDASGVIIVRVAGDYLFTAGVTWSISTPVSGTSFFILLWKNSVEIARGGFASYVTGAPFAPSIQVSAIAFDCAVGDYFQVIVWQDSGANQNLVIGPAFNYCRAKLLPG